MTTLPTLGNLALWAAMLAFAASWMAYLAENKSNRPTTLYLARARALLTIGAFALLIAGGALMRLIWTHSYGVSYVYSHVSNDLPTLYVISAFWAGQEGSFLLWAMLAGIVAFALYWRSGDWESDVMRVYLPSLIALVGLTIVSGPFKMLPQVPMDGAGLNPLLRDPWMAIHPPVTFLGYATLAAPFAYAIAGLRRSTNNDGWVRHALPWALIGWLALGAGIIMGGFWAYKVLGWGGWWGWDPVENASLLPWLTATALFHGLVLQRTRNKLARTNILMAVLTFALVIYSTFLTRSGVLEGASVHTFGKSVVGPFVGAWLGLVVVFGVGSLLAARKKIAGEVLDEPFFSREVLIFVGTAVLILMAGMVWLGTSAPALARLPGFRGMMGGDVSVPPAFYNRVGLWVGIPLALGIGLSVLLRWKGSGTVSRNALMIAGGLGLIAAVVATQFGITSPLMLLFAASGIFALAANVIVFERALHQGGWRLAGGYLAHIGVAFMLVAIVASTTGSKLKVDLPFRTPTQVMDYEMTFTGWANEPEGKQSAIIELKKAGAVSSEFMRPKLYEMYGSGQMMLRAEPDIRRSLGGDLYISPAQYLPPSEAMKGQGTLLQLTKGQSKVVGDVTYTFEAYDMGGGHGEATEFASVGARVKVAWPGGETEIIPRLSVGEGAASGATDLPEEVGGKILLQGMDADSGTVSLLLSDDGRPADGRAVGGLLTVEVSEKPLMGMLWTGVILALLGGMLALWRRALQLQPA